MENNTIEWKEEQLKSYKQKKKKLRNLKEQKEELDEKIKSVKAILYSGMPKGSNKKTDLSDCMVKMEELEEEIAQMENEINCAFLRIEKSIKDLENPDESSLIHSRYINGEKWEEISKKTGYSIVHLHRIKKRALSNIKI